MDENKSGQLAVRVEGVGPGDGSAPLVSAGKLTPRGLRWNRPATRAVVRHEGDFIGRDRRRSAGTSAVDRKALFEAAERRRAWRER